MDRASGFGPEGWGFEPLRGRQFFLRRLASGFYERARVKPLTQFLLLVLLSGCAPSPPTPVAANTPFLLTSATPALPQGPSEVSKLEKALPFDRLCVNVASNLIPLTDGPGPNLVNAVEPVRDELLAETGLVLPRVQFRDRPELEPSHYSILVREVEVGRGAVEADKVLAVGPAISLKQLKSPIRPTALGMGCWIRPAEARHAEKMGCTTYDSRLLVSAHLRSVFLAHRGQLFNRSDFLEWVSRQAPSQWDGLKKDYARQDRLFQVMLNLLSEQVPVQPAKRLREVLFASDLDPDSLTRRARVALREALCKQYASGQKIEVARVGPKTEKLLADDPSVPPLVGAGVPPILLVADPLRARLRHLLEVDYPDVVVLGTGELAPGYHWQVNRGWELVQ